MEENNNKNNVKVEWDLSQIYSNIDELKKDRKRIKFNRKNDNF